MEKLQCENPDNDARVLISTQRGNQSLKPVFHTKPVKFQKCIHTKGTQFAKLKEKMLFLRHIYKKKLFTTTTDHCFS